MQRWTVPARRAGAPTPHEETGPLGRPLARDSKSKVICSLRAGQVSSTAALPLPDTTWDTAGGRLFVSGGKAEVSVNRGVMSVAAETGTVF